MVQALIAEDEPLLAAALRDGLARTWPELAIAAVVHDGHSAWRELQRLAPEILFLDVEMPGINGLQVAHLVGARAHVVFVTAFDHYAVQAFEEGAVDYVLKPLDDARLALAVQRLKARLGQPAANLGGVLERARQLEKSSRGPLRWISVQQGRELRLVAADEVCYLRADHKYVAVVTADHEYLIDVPLKTLLGRLDPEVFWQVHRSTIVNVQAVHSICRGDDGRLSLRLKQRPELLALSPAYADRFRHW